MDNVNKILVIIKSPRHREQTAIERAEKLAKKFGAKIRLYSCVYNSYIAGVRFSDSPGLDVARGRLVQSYLMNLETHAEMLRARGFDVEVDAGWDYPKAEGVTREILRYNPDLVVTSADTSSGRYRLSHSDWELLRVCPAPLLLTGRKTVDGNIAASVDPMHMHDKPAALDHKIIATARMFADTDQDLHVVHALRPIAVVAGGAPEPVPMPIDIIDENVEKSHMQALQNLVASSAARGARTELVRGAPVRALRDYIEDNKIDLLVMGSVARGRIKRIFIGATAERVISHAACDVLVVKPDEFACPVSLVDETNGEDGVEAA